MKQHDNSEALRRADELDALIAAYGMPGRMNTERRAAALLRQQAERIAELEKEIADLHTTMFAAAVEIQEHWEAHCDAEGYGPANLMHRLERGIASQYGYDAKTLQRVEADRDQLRAEVERQTKALKIIHTWAGVPGALKPEHVRDLCGKALWKGNL